MERNGIVCYLDVYGYSAEAKGNNAEHAAKRLFLLWEEIGNDLRESGDIDYIAFSDCIFLGFDTKERQPSLLFETVVMPIIQCLTGKAAKYGYLLRGSAAYGAFLINENIVGGDAVIRAHKNESNLKTPVFHVPRAEITRINGSSSDQLPFECKEMLTRNGGLMQAILVTPHPMDDCISCILEKLEEAFEESNYEVAMSLKEALSAYGYHDVGQN